MKVNKWLNQQTDNLDATVFTGDCLYEKENRDYLRHFIKRWEEKMKSIEKHENDIDE